MKKVINEYGLALIYATIAIMFLGLVGAVFLKPNSQFADFVPKPSEFQVSAGSNSELNALGKPIFKVKSGTIDLGSTFNFMDFVVEAKDENGVDLKNAPSAFTLRGNVNTQERGAYNIEIIFVTNNFIQTKKTTIVVD